MEKNGRMFGVPKITVVSTFWGDTMYNSALGSVCSQPKDTKQSQQKGKAHGVKLERQGTASP